MSPDEPGTDGTGVRTGPEALTEPEERAPSPWDGVWRLLRELSPWNVAAYLLARRTEARARLDMESEGEPLPGDRCPYCRKPMVLTYVEEGSVLVWRRCLIGCGRYQVGMLVGEAGGWAS